MYELSWHTHQINLWIALTKFRPSFSQTLDTLGYETDVIEQRLFLHTSEGDEIVEPDVLLTSEPDKHSLVVDCKSETTEEDQIDRYLRLEENEEQLVIQGFVDDVSTDDLSAETVISSFEDLSSNGVTDEIAIIHFDNSPTSGVVIWNPDSHPFENDRLNNIFPINVDPGQPLPTGHYPFDVYEADKEALVSNIFSTVISLAMKKGEFSIEDILEYSHPYWDKIGSSKQDELLDRAEIVYLELLDAGLDEYLEKISGTEGREWRRTSKTIQAVQKQTDFYVDKVIDELPQARLDHDAWSTDSGEDRGMSADED